jgi:hypothetical protein
VLGIGWQKERINRATLTVLLLTVFFGFLLFKSRRFVEYFPAFTLVLLALSVGPVFRDWLSERPRLSRLGPLLLAAVLIFPMATTIGLARNSVADSAAADWYADAALWLARNGPEDSFVFQTDWDDFPRLFFFNARMIYTVGLDPTYMEIHNPELFDNWVELTHGDVEQMGEVIRDRYGAQYIFSDLGHGDFLQGAADDPLLTEIYRDDEAVIFAVETGEGVGSDR